MDDTKQNNNPNSQSTQASTQIQNTPPLDSQEQEELNEIKNLEKQEQAEVQADAAAIDKREEEGKELEKEAHNLPINSGNKAQ